MKQRAASEVDHCFGWVAGLKAVVRRFIIS